MSNNSADILPLLISAGSIAFAIIVALVSVWASSKRKDNSLRWKQKASDLDAKLAQTEAVFSAYSGIVLVWRNKIPDPNSDWGNPTVYGSPAALASLVRFAAPGDQKNYVRNLLEGLADHFTISGGQEENTLRKLIARLKTKGKPFSATIRMPGNRLIEADGSIAGTQAVLWLQDASIRASDEQEAISKFEKEKLTAISDPVAFIDVTGNLPFPVWRMSGANRIVWVNKAYIKAVDASSLDEVINKQIYIDEEIKQQAKDTLGSASIAKKIMPVIIAGKRKSSLITTYPISGGVAGIIIDASEADNLRQALKAHIRAHDETLNNMNEAVVIFGSDRRMNFHNKAFATMFGLDENFFTSRPAHEEWLDHLREKRVLPEQANYREWKQAELDYYLNWPDEVPEELWSMPDGRELRLVRMKDPQGGISLLFSDITDQLILQSKFNTQINVQAATLDKLTEGVAVFGSDGRLKIHNAAFAKMWDLPDEELNKQPRFKDLIHNFLRVYHDRNFWQDMQARTTDPSPEARRNVQGEIQRTDDKIMTYISIPLPDGATLIAWDDVTSSRNTEAALRERAEAMEAADRLKSEFVGHVSYQLRTPLTTISGYGELLQSGAAGELNDKQAEYVFAIQSAGEDLAKTIDDILDFAAIEADTIDLELGDVDIYDVLATTMEHLAEKAEDARIEMIFDCPENIGIIRADEKRIKQIVYNLLNNALRFTKPGGRVELGAMEEAGENSGIIIWVKDNGVGIPSDKQPQVFESFKSSRGGAGLGLALVERFVSRHGGWVELDSEEGKGTHVSVHLPRKAVLSGAEPELDLL